MESNTLNLSGILNPELYPAVYTRHEPLKGRTKKFSSQERPIEFLNSDLYTRFASEADRHLFRINGLWRREGRIWLLACLVFVCLWWFGPWPFFMPVPLFFAVLIFGMCGIGKWNYKRNDKVDEDIRELCLAFGEEFRRTTGYVPDYRVKSIYVRKHKYYTARVFVFVPVEAGTAPAAATPGGAVVPTAAAVTATAATTTATTAATTTRTTTIPITTEALERLVSMGFEEERVAEALRACDNDAERAADYLATTATDTSILPEAVAVLVPPTPPPSANVDRLVSMGFEEQRVVEALEFCDNDIERAAESLATTGEAASLAEEATHQVTVPAGVSAGQRFRIQLNTGGEEFFVTCPPGVSAGSRIGVRVA